MKNYIQRKFDYWEKRKASVTRQTKILDYWRTGPFSLGMVIEQQRTVISRRGTEEYTTWQKLSWHKIRLGWRVYRLEILEEKPL